MGAQHALSQDIVVKDNVCFKSCCGWEVPVMVCQHAYISCKDSADLVLDVRCKMIQVEFGKDFVIS